MDRSSCSKEATGLELNEDVWTCSGGQEAGSEAAGSVTPHRPLLQPGRPGHCPPRPTCWPLRAASRLG